MHDDLYDVTVKVLQRTQQHFFNYSLYICVWGSEETTGNTERATYSFQYETDAYIGSKSYCCVCLLEL